MKKFTLFLIATLFSAMSFAELNPYAYGLKSSHEGTTLTVNYSLNADATGVSVVILDGETEVKTIACEGITKGSHSIDVSTLDLPTGKSLIWKVVVTGNSVANPTLHDESIRFYLPYGMDVDVDPESDYMGNWYVIEASNDGKAKTGYQCNPFGRGLYAFDATLNPILNSAGTRGFLGGVNAGYTEKNINGDYVNFYRVATSGGRVFIGRYRDGASYHPIVEANPADLNANFTTVFETGRAVSIDAKGSGENLKLVMLAKDNNIYEYDLGNAKSIDAASRTINKGTLSIARDDATITYDNNGDIWFNQHQASPTANTPTIAHLSIENGFDWNNVSASISHANTSNSGIAVSPDGKQLAVVGAGQKNITIYNINDAGGNITLTKAYTIATAGNNHTALAWDYAGNLFAANRTNERIRIFAMPYSGTVSTPCASKHAFVIPPQLNPFAYNLTSELSADEKDLTIKYSLNANATSVIWVLMDGETPIKTVDLSSLGLEKGDYTTTISTTDFPQYKALTWKIEVKGVAVDEVTAVKGESFYRPFGVDIDNNPENPHFGRILCSETYTSSDTKYTSCGVGSGIYEYNPAFELIPNGDKPGYNAGKAFTNNDHSPYRIRISEDGRIFVTAHDQAGEFLWEVNPDNLNEWTSVFQGATHNTSKLLDASGKFIAGTNAGFDVRGTG
ncbi:MAG: beta-propeller fold lactonase family protein, partial [Paludibacteraceae bacterium]|nr:beta-propeller fold lactonase family protein [Paludibacteraceae bacterium]